MKILRTAAAFSLAAAALLLVPGLAAADTPSSLTVVGTSDVSDSGLMQNVIQPAFKAEYPQYTFKYVGSATGAAITSAEGGGNGASVLVVHAASLENQFLASGYSYNNQPGYAIWRNDFVLAGPATADPAGVSGNAAHNIAQAFADIATAGYNGGDPTPKVTFFDRLGSSGTTVEEHAIWQLVDSSGLRPAGLVLCTVNATSGGGEAPVDPTKVSGGISDGQACPSGGAPPAQSIVPDWYITANITQGPNVQAADACTEGSTGKPDTCYVFTDRGTYDYLESGSTPAINGTVSPDIDPNPLTILTRDDSADAPGGQDALVNYFHAYIINPTKVPAANVNITAAQDFINLLTSPDIQEQVKHYLAGTSDPGGAPFVPDASPILTDNGFAKSVSYGSSVTVTGTLTNAQPGYATLSGQTVTIDEIEAGVPVAVATGTTDEIGDYSIRFKPKTSGSYQVATGLITQIENTVLNPEYSDTLSPSATASAYVTVKGAPAAHSVRFSKISIKVPKHGKASLTASGVLKPAPALKGAKVELFAIPTTHGKQRLIGTAKPGAGKAKFTIKAKLGPGTYVFQLKYVQAKQTLSYSGLRLKTVR